MIVPSEFSDELMHFSEGIGERQGGGGDEKFGRLIIFKDMPTKFVYSLFPKNLPVLLE